MLLQESSVDLKYLQSLHNRHEEWLINKLVGKEYDLPVCVIDSDEEFETDAKRQEDMLAKVAAFAAKLKPKVAKAQ